MPPLIARPYVVGYVSWRHEREKKMPASILRRWRRLRLPAPTAGEWDGAYASGKWDFLLASSESARLAVVAHYVRQAMPVDATILDLGAGEGALADVIAPLAYRRYTGVDLSPVAIDKAHARADDRNRFITGDIATFLPDTPVDVIVVNEVLYYLADPAGCVARLLDHLRPGGAVVVSIYDKRKTRWLWRALAPVLASVDSVRLENGAGTRWRVAWMIRR